MNIKPWQKVTLAVMAGTAIYAGALDILTTQMEQHNKDLAKQKNEELAAQIALRLEFESKKKQLIDLEAQLSQAQQSTAKVSAELKVVNQQLAQLRAGKIPSSLSAAIAAAVPKVATSNTTSSIANLQPPPVQTVSRSSAP